MNWADILKLLTDSQEIITTGGWLLIVLIVFAENGLFFGFFLPGDYLLFLAGLFCSQGWLMAPLWPLTLSIAAAAIAGTYLGYFFGRVVGQQFLHKKDSLFFKYKYVVQTRAYFMKYGGRVLIVSKFLPIVRTFAPILAGVVEMDIRRFSTYSITGSLIWVFTLVLGGYYLGQAFPGLINYIEYVVIGFFSITALVVLKGFLSARQKKPRLKVMKPSVVS